MSTVDRNEAINGAIGHLQFLRTCKAAYVLETLPRVRELLGIAEREARDQVEQTARGGAEQLLLPVDV